ncbi:MAG TPA: histidine phosphatase family protein [Feifaniaceae bacterium]|nr:histidine phosphatase family protein [Feifaniaceae bacterium]
MRLYIVRHGNREDTPSYYNEKLRHQDFPITGEGEETALRLAEYFAAHPVKKLYVSEYLRAAQTAAPVAKRLGLTPAVDARLNEIDNGIVEQLTDEEIMARYPEFWRDFWSGQTDVRFPEGETGEEVKSRQADLLRDLVTWDEDCLLVSHEGYIRLLLCHILGLPVYRRRSFHIDFCGVTELLYEKETGAWKVLRVNHTV